MSAGWRWRGCGGCRGGGPRCGQDAEDVGATGLCGSCTWAGGVPVAEALDAPDENLGCRLGVAQGALLGCLSEDGCRVVARGFGGGEGGCECGPGSLGEDLSG